MIDLKTFKNDVQMMGLDFDIDNVEQKEVSSNTKIQMVDEMGYLYSISRDNYYNFKKRNGRPAIFFNRNPHTFENINRYFEINNISLELLTETPTSAIQKLSFRCKLHDEVFERSWNCVKNGQILCRKCEGSHMSYTIDIAKQKVAEEYDCKLIATQWSGTGSYYDFECTCGELFNRRFDVVVTQGLNKCRKCTGSQGKYTQEEVERELGQYGIALMSQYQSLGDKILVKYPCGETIPRTLNGIRVSNYACPHCNNDSYNMNNEKFQSKVLELTGGEYEFLEPYQGYKTKLTVLHHGCGHTFKISPNKFIRRHQRCPICSDGISYPEKYVGHVLNALGVSFETQKRFAWSQERRYDFYIPALNMIIEAHGIQHYQESGRGRSLKEEQENDLLKFDLSVINGIDRYIVLDCSISKSEHIKNSIVNSGLSSIFDLSNIDFNDCHLLALKSLALEARDLYLEGETVIDIAEMLGVSVDTVKNYLKATVV